MKTPDNLPEVRLIQLQPPSIDGASAPKGQMGYEDDRLALVQAFLAMSSLSANTRNTYARELKRFLDWTNLDWSQIQPMQMHRYKAHLLHTVQTQEGKPLSQRSVNVAITALRSFFKWMVAHYPDRMPTNPMREIRQELGRKTRLDH
jgi:integrase/recombinase XerD